MTRGVDMKKLRERHAMMLAFQRKIAPFSPTMQEVAEIWGVVPSHCRAILERMVGLGLVITRKRHNWTFYFAVSAIDPE